MNLKQEIGTSKSKISTLKNKISNCNNEELKEHLKYQLKQEQIKLEGFELLLSLYKRIGTFYE